MTKKTRIEQISGLELASMRSKAHNKALKHEHDLLEAKKELIHRFHEPIICRIVHTAKG